ncbi:DUF6157 family protein [Dyadobacter chenhuakuii]|uniref:DUF6157 family protein n=1 Tax=Dyadobacter chenhuakuii TaxID=2909339 RepID=A0A9X1QDU4_9BACT|nr:DUF6157 family protein [Dyadobacter chenhuakuii]MCF2499266.1 DUF6157 family protein [Dyadobacter chenhuakuii]
MKTHTTNYFDTFIQVAEDSQAKAGEVPPTKGAEKSVANIQFEIISAHPYQYTSDDVLFQTYAVRQGLDETELEAEREKFFSKGQPCLRASPLTKRYGWGVHSNAEGKVALYGLESKEYNKLSSDEKLKTVKAMRSKRA